MKLQNKQNRRKKNILIVVAILAGIIVVALVAGLTLINSLFKPLNEYGISHIMLYSLPDKTTYFVGDEFDPTGLKVQVITYGDKEEDYFVDHNGVKCTGFDSSAVNDNVTITVSYRGVTNTFTVKIVDVPNETPTAVDMQIENFKTTYTKTEWNTMGPDVIGATIKCVYSDGSIGEAIPLQRKWIDGRNTTVNGPCTLDVTIIYNDKGTRLEKTVTITITE